MKTIGIAIAMLCWSVVGFAQLVKVVDKSTLQPIPGCTIINKVNNASLATNKKGQADISEFKGSDSISFSFISHTSLMYSYAELQTLNFEVQLKEKNVALNEFIISSNRWSENKIVTPNRVEKINMKEMAFQNPQTAADLLGSSGYAFIQKSQMGGGSPMLRGYATNRVLLVIDGVRMNTAIFRAGNVQNVISLDANALESTEIIFGPGSVMYGSDAIGGVMSFQTLTPQFTDSAHKKINVSGNALMRYSSANSENTGHLDFNVGTKYVAFTTSFTRADYGDLRSGSEGGDNYFYRRSYVQTIDNKDYMVANPDSTLQIGSKYDQINFMQKVRIRPNKNWDIDYGFHLSETSSFNRYDRLYIVKTDGPYKRKLRWAEWYYGPQKWNMHRLGITHTKANVLYNKLSLVGAIQNFEESRYDREFMVRELHMQKETVKALNLNLDLEKKIGSKLTVLYGADVVHNTVGSEASLTQVVTRIVDSAVTRYPNGSTWDAYGAYLNLKYNLTSKLVLNGGVRYSTYQIKAKFDTTYFAFPFTTVNMQNDAVNGSVGLVYSPLKSWQIYVNGATGFRAPNIDDMGKVFESTPGYLVVPNPDLKPEQVYNAELGTVKSFGNFFNIDFAGYYTYLKDGMVRKDFLFNGSPTIRYLGNKSIVQAVQNVTEIYVHGIQAGIEVFVKGIGLKSNISYQNGKEQTPDSLVFYPLRHAAPTFGSTHLTYTHKLFKLDFYAVYNAKMEFEQLALTEQLNSSYAKDDKGKNYSAAWYTLNFKAAAYVNKYVTLTGGVENIMDILYRPYSSGISAPGRNLIVSLRARF